MNVIFVQMTDANIVDVPNHTDSVATVSKVFDTNKSSDTSRITNDGVVSSGQLTIQNSGWASQLTPCMSQSGNMILINDNTSRSGGALKLMPEDKVCLVPVDVSTGQIVENLPKLLVPLKRKSMLKSLTDNVTEISSGGSDKQHLKIINVKSLANGQKESAPEVPQNQQLTLTFRLPSPGQGKPLAVIDQCKVLAKSVTTTESSTSTKPDPSGKNTIVQLPYPGAVPMDSKHIYAIHQEPSSMQVMQTISETDPPNMLEIGGITVENSDLLSQAVWFKGGERAVNCITYSYDTSCHMTSPGLIITPRVVDGHVAVESEMCEVRTRRFKKLQLSELGPDPGDNGPTKTIPMLVSEQSLQRFSDIGKKSQKRAFSAALVDDKAAADGVNDVSVKEELETLPQEGGGEKTLPQEGGGEKTLPQEGGGEKTLPQEGGGEKTLPQEGGGEKTLPQEGGDEKTLPQEGGGEKTLPQEGGGEKTLPQDGGGEKPASKSTTDTVLANGRLTEDPTTSDAVIDAAEKSSTAEADVDVPLDPVDGDTNDTVSAADQVRQQTAEGDDGTEIKEVTAASSRTAGNDASVGILRKMLQKGDLDNGDLDDDLDDIGDDWLSQYGCYLCRFVSTSVEGVMRHWVREHVSQKPYLCSHCHAVFSTSYKARWHIQKFHGGREITIGLRPSEVYRTPLIFEIEWPENMTTNSCWADEPRKGNGAGYYDDDQEQHQGQFFCRKCNFTCSSTYMMKRHIREQHLQYRPFSCTHCHATFTCSYDMKRHLAAKHDSLKDGNSVVTEGGKGSSNVFIVNPYRMGEAWEICSTGLTASMLCRHCNFVTTSRRAIYGHVMDKHPRPDSVMCACCKVPVPTKFNSAGRSLVVRCPRCGAKLQLCSDNEALPTSMLVGGQGHVVHICKICDYKTREKSGMTRHIKYNHTQCRPYMCPYCTYAAVERPKVRIHIASNHRGKPMRVNKSERAVQEFRDTIAALFKKLTFTVNDKDEVDLYEGEGQEYGADLNVDAEPMTLTPMQCAERQKRRVSTVRELLRAKRRRMKNVSEEEEDSDEDTCNLRLPRTSGYKRKMVMTGALSPGTFGTTQCSICQVMFRSPAACWKHKSDVHNLKVSNREGQVDKEGAHTGGVKRLVGEHFRCNLCGYRCHDRSCMARHIKYMHLSGRPHSCPFCEYTNVEKTKVRLHVRAAHPNKPQRVNTDERMLVMLSAEVKKHYTKVNHYGKTEIVFLQQGVFFYRTCYSKSTVSCFIHIVVAGAGLQYLFVVNFKASAEFQI